MHRFSDLHSFDQTTFSFEFSLFFRTTLKDLIRSNSLSPFSIKRFTYQFILRAGTQDLGKSFDYFSLNYNGN